MKLHLGCGRDFKPDYINIDMEPPFDVQHNLRTRLPFDDGSVDEILANDVIQHLDRKEWQFAKKDWVRVLKPSGKLELSCWNFIWVLNEFLLHPDEPYAMQRIYGGQDGEYDYFKNGFTWESLKSSLEEEGMSNFTRLESGNEFICLVCYK